MEEVRRLNVLIDVNVLLDVLLDRAPWVDQAREIWTAHHRRALVGHLAAHALPNIFYIARKIVGIQKARGAVHLCLQTFEIAPIGRAELELADSLTGSDLEDNLVLACATLARLDAVVTRDPKGFACPPIPVITPDELLARIPKGGAN
ncbi:MAG: PIN domain-containing protein [Singulisphaera sp.]|nr:PIN domain-containing protein [Singulisphaera sp.]